MDVTRLIVVRHGETDWNVGARFQGQLDIALNDNGRWQARRAAEALAGESIAAVYASDLSRALHTATEIARPHELDVVAEPLLRERSFGHFEGHTIADIEARWPGQAERLRARDPAFAPGDGESLVAFRERVTGTFAVIGARHPGEAVLVVTHGGVLDVLYRAAIGLELHTPRAWPIENAAINRLHWSREGLALAAWSDIAHLAATSLDETTA